VDDEETILDTVCAISKSVGYSTSRACCGQDTISAAVDSCPSLLLCDVMMPGLNGFEIALQIKKRCPGCRILLFSEQVASALMARDLGQVFSNLGYRFELLSKPLHPSLLLHEVQQALSLSESRAQG